MNNTDLDQKAAELKLSRIPFCWATVVEAKGSAPRHIGAKMLVTAKESYGTIGGGALEHRVIEDARKLICKRHAKCMNYPLGPLLGQCCGGEVNIFIEPIILPKPMYVFGAGHIASALCPMLPEIGFDVTLIDERQEYLVLPCFAGVGKKLNELPSDALKKLVFNEETHIIVITHEHRHDEEIIRGCFNKPFTYLGCIGSRHKWEKFKARYRAQGIDEEQILRVTTPIGFDIGAETPFEIAISIISQLIQLHAKPDDFAKGVGHF